MAARMPMGRDGGWDGLAIRGLMRAARTGDAFQAMVHGRGRGRPWKRFEGFPFPETPRHGGANRNRTDDLLNAIQALSQLSYGPAVLR